MRLYASKRQVENRFMIQYVVSLVVFLLVVAAAMTWNVLRDHNGVSSVRDHPQSQRITEDDPRWDCASMGNRTCGPTGPVHGNEGSAKGG